MRRLILLSGIWVLSAVAQHVGENKTNGTASAPTFTSSTQLVIETVSVKDNNGRTVEGLTAKDFTVTEDGVKQTIRLFDFERLPEAPGEASPRPGSELSFENTPPKLTRTQISPEISGQSRYGGRRLLALYFDMTSMPPDDQVRALIASQKFILNQMTAADVVAIMRYSGSSVDVLQDFTGDREKLLMTLQRLIIGEGQGFDEGTNDDSTPDTGTAFGQDDSEFNIFNTDRQLSALQTAAQMLGTLSEKKSLIYFASGLQLNGLDNQAQLHATLNSAVRAGVSFWPIDARGLVSEAPLGDATHGSPGGIGMYNGNSALAVITDFQRSQDVLYALAADTGGKALLDNNDLSRGIAQAQTAISSYYIIGYYNTNTAMDGRFRRIKISLNENPSAKLDYRQGYFAGKQFKQFTLADKERQLEDALLLDDPITELTIAMEIDYFQLNRAEYFVPLTVKIPGRELALARRGGAEHTLIDFIGEIKDDAGATVQNVRDKVDVKLSEATAAELVNRPLAYVSGFTLLPGTYALKFLARDAETGRIGTYESTFVVPNLNKQDIQIPISSVILSSQRTEMKDAVYSAGKDKGKTESVNPLVQGGRKLIPSVTRVFSRSRPMYVYLQAYEPKASTVEPLVVSVAFYQGRMKAYEASPIEVDHAMDSRIRAIPLEFSLPLDKLQPGEYRCQVTVLNPNEQAAAFWQTNVMLVP